MMNSYCVKCKKQTRFKSNPKVARTKNNRYMLVGNCSICNTKKTRFISQQQGHGLLGKLFGLPGGKVPILSDIPLIGSLI